MKDLAGGLGPIRNGEIFEGIVSLPTIEMRHSAAGQRSFKSHKRQGKE